MRFTTTAALVHELVEAVDDRRLQRLQKTLVSQDLLIIDELGFVPLSKTGAELLFEIISQRYERGSIIITSNLPFDEWTEVFGSERLTGAILDRLTHHVHILESRSSRRHRSEPDGRRRELPAPTEPQGQNLIQTPERLKLAFGQCASTRASYLEARAPRRPPDRRRWGIFHRSTDPFCSGIDRI